LATFPAKTPRDKNSDRPCRHKHIKTHRKQKIHDEEPKIPSHIPDREEPKKEKAKNANKEPEQYPLSVLSLETAPGTPRQCSYTPTPRFGRSSRKAKNRKKDESRDQEKKTSSGTSWR
jgi:hypothetical protein